MSINKGDRTILITLIILLAGYVAYASFRRSTPDPVPTPQPLMSATTVDSIAPLDTTHHDDGAKHSPVDTSFITTDKYPGPPERQQWAKSSKLAEGATIDLNSADTLLLQRVPGIGPVFARRIFKYREMLGGYYAVEQLQEVYGMDREHYDQIAPFFAIRTAVRPFIVTQDSIPYHPYLQWRHKKALRDLLRKGAPINWEKLMKSPAFSKDDSLRLVHYLRFEENSAEIKPTP